MSVHRSFHANLLVVALLSCGLGACSSPSDPEDGAESNDSTGSGGTSAKGGNGGSSGSAKAGANSHAEGAQAGSSSSGGSKGTGGGKQTAGNVNAGGSNSGGAKATGGSSAVGKGGKAESSSGGSSAVDSGARDSGAGSSITVDSGARDSAVADSTASGTGSPGCGSTNPLKTSNSLTENINGTTRKWMLDVPANYDTNKPYRLIFVWHPLSGSGSQIVSGDYNGLKSLSNSTAIFATADGLNGSNSEASGTGWWNKDGGDMKLVQAMLDKINAGLCVDQQRIFSTGFSFGGMMSYTLPFEFNVFRAVAPCSGKTGVIPYNEKYSDPVAIMAFHGDSDTFVATNLGKAFFDKFTARNKCGTQTQAVSPNGCVQYQGCVVPSTWCIFPGAHTTWSEEPAAIWKFFSQF